ncbi:hypothetical protein ACSBR1_023596 [Camellia fascicularis]
MSRLYEMVKEGIEEHPLIHRPFAIRAASWAAWVCRVNRCNPEQQESKNAAALCCLCDLLDYLVGKECENLCGRIFGFNLGESVSFGFVLGSRLSSV